MLPSLLRNLSLSPKPVIPFELGTHPKLTQIADALVYVGGEGGDLLPTPGGSGGFRGFRVDKIVDTFMPLTMN